MKKYWFLFFLSVPVFAANPQEQEAVLKDLSGGMNSYQTPDKIPDNAASFIQNFYTDIEPIAVERNGYVKRDSTVLGATNPAYGLWEFVDGSGNDWIITYSSRTYYKNTVGNTPTAFGPVTTVNQIPDCATNLGVIMCVNGTNTDWYFDGTSTASVSSAPLGTLIEPWRTRFAIGKINGAQSTIQFSADGSTTNWTLGGNPTDPFSIQIGGANDGEYIRCMHNAYLDTFIIGRKYDLWGMDGFAQDDVSVRNISDHVGCIEPRTVQEVDGELVWLSARGIEAMNGRAIRSISEPIRNVTDVIVKNTSNARSNTQTSDVDWGSGTFSDAYYADTITASGKLQFTFPDTFDSFRDGTSGTKLVWSTYTATSLTPSSVSSSSGKLVITSSNDFTYAYSATAFPPLQVGTTITFTNLKVNGGYAQVIISSRPLVGSEGDHFKYVNFAFTINIFSDGAGGLMTINPSVGVVSIPRQDSTDLSLWISTSNFSLFSGTTTIKNGSHSWGGISKFVYIYVGYLGTNPSISGTIDDFRIIPLASTFTWTSPLLTVGSLISSWGSVSAVTGNTDAGTITYQVGSTNTANVNSISNFTSVLVGGVPSIPTNPYAGDKFSFQRTVSSATPYLDAFIITWNEGGIIPAPVSIVYDRRYWLSYTTNTVSSPTLDSIYVWQRNKSWTYFKGINAGSFSLWRDALYFGNSNSTGYVYKFDTGNDDDGAAITSEIFTKSYDLDTGYRDKFFRNSFITYTANVSFTGSFALSYDLDRLGQDFSLGTVGMNEGTGQLSVKAPFSFNNPVQGREIQYKIVKTGTGDRLKLHDLVLKYGVKEEQ